MLKVFLILGIYFCNNLVANNHFAGSKNSTVNFQR